MANGLNILFSLGRPFSPLYGTAMRVRERFYTRGVFRQYSFAVPVISVGNLVLGGTGKTPTVKYIARLLLSNGFKPCVVSRGYGGTANADCNIVSDGSDMLLSATEAGDEPYYLAQSLPAVPVLTGRKRHIPCQVAIERFGSDCIVLDDGFSHLRVKRDIDLVLFDSTYLAGNSRIFPGGPLREPVTALTRCSSFILTGVTESNSSRAESFGTILHQKFPEKNLYTSSLSAATIENHWGKSVKKSDLGQVFSFCGIANPSRLLDTLQSLQIDPIGFETFKDHAKYSQEILDKLIQKALKLGADSLVTTEKDFVKIEELDCKMPVYIIGVEPTFTDNFDHYLLTEVKNCMK